MRLQADAALRAEHAELTLAGEVTRLAVPHLILACTEARACTGASLRLTLVP